MQPAPLPATGILPGKPCPAPHFQVQRARSRYCALHLWEVSSAGPWASIHQQARLLDLARLPVLPALTQSLINLLWLPRSTLSVALGAVVREYAAAVAERALELGLDGAFVERVHQQVRAVL